MVFFKGDIMKNTVLFSILIIAIMVMAGAFVYFQVQKTSGYPDYHVNVYLNYTKGNITVDYGHNSINSIVVPSKAWFNVSLKAYSNYSYSFYQNNTPLYFNYSGLNNSGFYTGFLDKNVTVSLNFMGTDLNVPDIHKFNITLTGVPTGTGTYQQLLTIDPAAYGINPQGSNVLFYDPNGTELYAWLQSINSTSASYWIKNFNGSSTINMQVLPSFENLFSATGYLGEAPQLSSTYGEYDNGKDIFPIYYNFATNTGNLLVPSGAIYSINNGLNYSSNTTVLSSNALLTPFSPNWIDYTEIENVKVSGYGNSEGNGYVSFAGERANSGSTGYQSYVEAYSSGLDMYNYNGTPGSGVVFSGINDNFFNVIWGSYSNSSSYVEYNNKITYNLLATEPNNINNLQWYTYSNYYFILHYVAIAHISMPSMPTFTIGTGNSTAFTHEIILESD